MRPLSLLILFLIYSMAHEVEETDRFDFPLPWSKDAIQVFPDLPIVAPDSKDPKCREDSLLIMQGLRNNSEWAVRMWDATAHNPSGLLYGSLRHLGNFDECADIVGPVKTKFCIAMHNVFISPDLENNQTALHFMRERGREDVRFYPRSYIVRGMCLPASCPLMDLTRAMNGYLGNLEDDERYGKYVPTFMTHNVVIAPRSCTELPVEQTLTDAGKYCWIFIMTMFLLCALCGIVECYSKDADALHYTIKAFSLRRNAVSLFDVKPDHTPLAILNGFKFIGALGVYWSHGVMLVSAISNSLQIAEEYYLRPSHMIILRIELVLELFLLSSSLLLTYSTLASAEKGNTIDLVTLIAKRFFRIAPVTYFLQVFGIEVARNFGSGPMWQLGSQTYEKPCRENWWVNLLFLQNIIRHDAMCVPETWYIATDFQLFIVGTILLKILVKNEFLGLSLLSILTVLGCFIPGVMTYYMGISGAIGYRFSEIIDDYLTSKRIVHFTSYGRSSSFWVGIFAGYFLFKTRKSPNWSAVRAWTIFGVGMTLFLGCIFYPIGIVQHEVTDKRVHAVFAGTQRLIAAIGLACIICFHRFWPTRLFQIMFTSKFYVFMSKISLSLYLVQCMVIFRRLLAMRQAPLSVFKMNQLTYLIADMTIVTILSIIVTLIFERPFRNLFDELLSKRRDVKIQPSKED